MKKVWFFLSLFPFVTYANPPFSPTALKQNDIYQAVKWYRDSAEKSTSDKNPRFNAINSGKYDAKQMVWSNTLPSHQVIAYFGDIFRTFQSSNSQLPVAYLSANSSLFAALGNGYFIFPNHIYGSWEANQYK